MQTILKCRNHCETGQTSVSVVLRKPGRGRPPIPNRLVLNAIWYVLWTGCQWKALPSAAFGVSSSAAHARFQKWQEQGIFEQVMVDGPFL
ncbi:MAG: transposase [Caldilineaceae bacterium]